MKQLFTFVSKLASHQCNHGFNLRNEKYVKLYGGHKFRQVCFLRVLRFHHTFIRYESD